MLMKPMCRIFRKTSAGVQEYASILEIHTSCTSCFAYATTTKWSPHCHIGTRTRSTRWFNTTRFAIRPTIMQAYGTMEVLQRYCIPMRISHHSAYRISCNPLEKGKMWNVFSMPISNGWRIVFHKMLPSLSIAPVCPTAYTSHWQRSATTMAKYQEKLGWLQSYNVTLDIRSCFASLLEM